MARDSTPPRRQPPRLGLRILKGILFAILLLIVALLSMLAGFYVAVARTLPTLQLSQDISSAQTTRIYDDSETPVLLAELHGPENRDILAADQIPQLMRDAVVAIEDERFYEHSGVDFVAILRAAWANVTHGEIVQGGSTITQQLVKNAFVTDERTLDRKFREAALAYQLEKKWSKEKILNEYLNIIYFGAGAYGVEAAALTYFGVHAADLTIPQAALLAGLPKAPSSYSPRRDPDAAMTRRDLVLNKMFQQDYITSEELQQALAAPLRLAEVQTADEVAVPYWIEMIREQLVAHYGSSTVLGGGLRVYTSIDTSLQTAAEEAVAEVLDQPGDPSAAVVTIDVRTGRMVAMVGGSSFSELQFNLATQGKRQPGSAFKTFVLVSALQQGLSPETTYESGPITIDLSSGPWEVSSTDKGLLTLADATAQSSNGVYARLIMELGAGTVAQTAYDMGITTPLGDNPNPAIALGGLTTGVSPLEMAMAYATLATGGERLSQEITFNPSQTGYPITIVRVTDSDDNLLDQNSMVRTRILDEGLASMATACLELVITSGTGTSADIGRPAAGKTGTTQNYADAWFVGYTPEFVTAVWVGYPSEQKPMTDVHGLKVTGGSLPAQIWAAFMKKALADVPVSDFKGAADEEWLTLEVCSESHLLPTEFCPSTMNILFKADERPVAPCSVHVAQEVPVPDVVGMPLDEALKVLETAHFQTFVLDDTASSQPAGAVVTQEPAAGTTLLQGETVILYVSAGEGTIAVPDVVGLDAAAARATIADAGLAAQETSVEDVMPAGTVLSQDPPGGTQVAPGSVVTLLVSMGSVEPPPD
jgi:penicillin-binding protein 1A